MTETTPTRLDDTERIAATTVAWLLAGLFALFGLSKLAAAEMQVAMFEGWGYPLWFMHVVGAAEVAAALLLIVPRTAFYGASIVVGLMVGGFATHAAAGEVMQLPLPLATGAAAMLLAVLRRPAWLTYGASEATPAQAGERA